MADYTWRLATIRMAISHSASNLFNDHEKIRVKTLGTALEFVVLLQQLLLVAAVCYGCGLRPAADCPGRGLVSERDCHSCGLL